MHCLRFQGVTFLLLTCLILISCSSSKNPVMSRTLPPFDLIDSIVISESDNASNRSTLAVYDAAIDPDAKTFTITPSERIADYHFALTQLYPNVVQIVNYGWTPSFWTDIKITHPLPYSGIDGFDPRVIAILPANPGVSMNYPTMNVVANNSVVLNPDGYTRLQDWVNPSIPGNANPFLAYFKHVEYRRWFSSGTGMMSDTRRWEIDLNGFGGPMVFKLAVDVSLNYPEQPQQIIDNAQEPIEIDFWAGGGLTPAGGSTQILATVFDWQGSMNIKVYAEAPDLFDSAITLRYLRPGSEPNEYVFVGTIANLRLAPEGEYGILIAATDYMTGISMAREFYVKVLSAAPENPVDVTPEWLNFGTNNILTEGNYAYTIKNNGGRLDILNIYDPVNPLWINKIDLPDYYRACASQGYVYAACGTSGLKIIDVDPPELAQVVNTIDTASNVYEVNVSDGYAYLGTPEGIHIVDVTPPETAQIINTINVPYPGQIFVVNGYAHVIFSRSIVIYDVDPPDQAYQVKALSYDFNGTWGFADIYVSNGYAFVTHNWWPDYPHAEETASLFVIDVDPPESAFQVPGKLLGKSAGSVFVSNGYAYIAARDDSDNHVFYIIDIDPIDTLSIVKTIYTDENISGISIMNDYAYAASSEFGLKIIDIEPPSSAYVVKTMYSTYSPRVVNVKDGYAFVADLMGVLLVNVTPPEMSQIVKVVPGTSGAGDLYVSDGYAYTAEWSKGVRIIDIEPPESAHSVGLYWDSRNTPSYVSASNGYAYATGLWDTSLSFKILDVDPPNSPQLINTIDIPSGPQKSFATDEYVFTIADWGSELDIIDINPPDSAFIAKTIDIKCGDIFVSEGYAYVPSSGVLNILDIDPADSAFILNSVNSPTILGGKIYIYGGYAYITGLSDIDVIDIDPPEEAYVYGTFDAQLVHPHDIFIYDGYAYALDYEKGLRIFKLW